MRRLAALLGTIFLVACTAGDHEDLREWMKTAAQDTKAKIPPLAGGRALRGCAL